MRKTDLVATFFLVVSWAEQRCHSQELSQLVVLLRSADASTGVSYTENVVLLAFCSVRIVRAKN